MYSKIYIFEQFDKNVPHDENNSAKCSYFERDYCLNTIIRYGVKEKNNQITERSTFNV